jgi:hypothetical protein
MLVMRNFGYLGLHNVVNNKSSLARHRLVDFTGELQVRRRTKDDSDDRRDKRRDSDNYRLKLPPWHPLYIAEPVQNGGRISDENAPDTGNTNIAEFSKLYAQELAPLPLMLAPASILSTGTQGGITPVRTSFDDIEPIYHTTFCNELICHPRILHNCENGYYSIKVELREVEWNESLNAFLAHVPRPGTNPCIHNSRRGPFLVPSAFTSCNSGVEDNHFIDEFKIKLPFDLTPTDQEGKKLSLSLFFSVFKVKTDSKSKWKRGAKMILGASILDSLRSTDEINTCGRAKLVACGFLPLAPQSCLLDDGIHDVRVPFTAKPLPAEMCTDPLHSSSCILFERDLKRGGIANVFNRESVNDDATMSLDSRVSDHRNDIESSVQTDDSSTDFQSNDDSNMRNEKNSSQDHISLSVRTKTLNCFVNAPLKSYSTELTLGIISFHLRLE